MTEEQFFNEHQILFRRNGDVYQWIVLTNSNGNTRKYNFDNSNIDSVLFEFYTGRSFDDEMIEIVANEIRADYNVDLVGN